MRTDHLMLADIESQKGKTDFLRSTVWLSVQGDTFSSTDKLADPDVVKNISLLQETGKKRENSKYQL